MDLSKILIIGVVLLYIAVMVAIGLYFRRKAQNSLDKFWSADASIGWFVNSFAILATIMSGGGMLGNIGSGASIGITLQMMGTIATPIGVGLGGVLVVQPLRKSGAKNLSDFYHLRYDSKIVGVLAGAVVVITYTVYLMAQLKAGGTVSETLLGTPYMVGVVIVWAVFTVYTILGGMLAVSWNDFLQGILMVVVVVVSAGAGLAFYGWDFKGVMATATEYFPNIGRWYFPTISNVGGFVTWVLAGICAPTVLMRVATAKSPFSAGMAMQTAMLWLTIFCAGTILILSPVTRAFAGAAPLANNDAYFMVFVSSRFGPVMQGVVASAIFAAIMSTAAGLLLAASAALSNDILKKVITIKPNNERKVGIVCILVIAVVALGFSTNPPPLLSIFYAQAMTFLIACLAGPFLLGLWWKRATSAGAVAGIFCGAAAFIYGTWINPMPLLSQTCLTVPVCLAATIIGSLLSKKPDVEMVRTMESWHDASDYGVATEAIEAH